MAERTYYHTFVLRNKPVTLRTKRHIVCYKLVKIEHIMNRIILIMKWNEKGFKPRNNISISTYTYQYQKTNYYKEKGRDQTL